MFLRMQISALYKAKGVPYIRQKGGTIDTRESIKKEVEQATHGKKSPMAKSRHFEIP